MVDYRNRESGRVRWLLTLHSAPSGRVYAAYGGIYIGTSLVWLALVDGVRRDRWDVFGSGSLPYWRGRDLFAPRAAQ